MYPIDRNKKGIVKVDSLFFRFVARFAIVVSVILLLGVVGLILLLILAPQYLPRVLLYGIIAICFLTAVWVCICPSVDRFVRWKMRKGMQRRKRV